MLKHFLVLKSNYWHIINGTLQMYSEYFRNALDYFWNQLSFGLSEWKLEDESSTNFCGKSENLGHNVLC